MSNEQTLVAGIPAAKRNWRSSSIILFVAAAVLVVILALIVFGPVLPSYQPYNKSLIDSDLGFWQAGSDGILHPLGTDPLGTDVLSQLILGGRLSLTVAALAVAISVMIGPLVGAVAGYFGGFVDHVIVGAVDVLLAVPRVLVIIAVVAIKGPSLGLLVALLGLTGWAQYARVMRAQTLSLRAREFIDAAISMGSSDIRILRQHIFPNAVAPIVVIASFDIGGVVVTEAALSYLGLGIQPPDTSWGLMIQRAQEYLNTDPRLLFVPSTALILFVLSINFTARYFTGELGGQRRLAAGGSV